jgi:hypothetical protein
MHSHPLPRPKPPHPPLGLSLQGYVTLSETQDLGQARPDGVGYRSDLRALTDDHHIYVRGTKAFFGKYVYGSGQEIHGVRPFPFLIPGRKVTPYVPGSTSTEDRINDGVGNRIPVRVPG